jgi:hypothetical protein
MGQILGAVTSARTWAFTQGEMGTSGGLSKGVTRRSPKARWGFVASVLHLQNTGPGTPLVLTDGSLRFLVREEALGRWLQCVFRMLPVQKGMRHREGHCTPQLRRGQDQRQSLPAWCPMQSVPHKATFLTCCSVPKRNRETWQKRDLAR